MYTVQTLGYGLAARVNQDREPEALNPKRFGTMREPLSACPARHYHSARGRTRSGSVACLHGLGIRGLGVRGLELV